MDLDWKTISSSNVYEHILRLWDIHFLYVFEALKLHLLSRFLFARVAEKSTYFNL